MVWPFGAFLCPPDYAAPAGLRAIAREVAAFSETSRLVRRTVRDRLPSRLPALPNPGPPATGPVVLVPGFMAGDTTLLLLSRHLRRVGYRTYRSRIRANVGCTAKAALALEGRVERLVEERGGKATLVGHSLGGLLARAVAAQRPDLVDGIVTLGSPMLAPGAVHRLLALDLALLVALQRVGVAALMGLDCTSGECARTSWERAQAGLDPGVAFTSIFSRRDGIVDWRSCLDPGADTVEVAASHLGMAVDPDVFDLVADVIGQQRTRDAITAPVAS